MAKAQNLNECTIAGKVVSIDYTEAVVKGKDALYGTVTIEAGEDNFVPVGFFTYKVKKDNTPNGIYASLLSVIKDYKTIANDGREAADTVIIDKAQLGENVFFLADGRMIRDFQISSAFYNRKIVTKPEATFTIVGEIFEMVEEVIDDLPTGALLIRLLVLGYEARPNILDFKVVDPKGVDYIKAVASVGQELKVNGDIIVNEIVEEKKEESAFGDPIITSTRKTVRELVIKSATPPVTGTLTDEERTQVLSVREGLVADAKAKAAAKAKTNGAAKSTKSPNNFTL